MSVPEGWKESSLATMLEKLKDGTHFSPQICGGEFKYITSKNVKMGNLDLGNIQYIDEIQHKKIFRGSPVQYGDVLFTKDGANAGNVCLNTLHEEFSILSSVAILSGEKDVADNIFLLNLLMWDNTQAAIKNNVSGQAITRLTLKQIGELRFVFPPLAEQKKIAAILSTWDKAIEATDKMLENARQQKKALIQQLLRGRKRLPGFSGKLRELSLSKFCSRITERNNGASKNVMTISGQQGFVPQRSFFSKQIASDNISSYFLVKNGDFVYNKSYCNGYPMGAIKRLTSHEEAVVTTLYICFSITKNYAHSDYLEQYFEAGLLNTKITQIATEGGRAHGLLNVKPADFMALRIPLPPLPEQQAIARVLTTADKEIDALTQKAALLRQEKRALMQQLLTGKKRVQAEESYAI